MAPRSTNLVFFFFFVLFVMFSASSIQGRKLLMNNNSAKVAVVPTLEDMRLFFNALPKGKVPPSTPTKKGHSVGVDEEKLIARHLAAVDRILQSIPSPGVGH